MGALLALLGGLLSTVGGFFAQWFGKRVAVKLTLVTVALGFLASFIAAIHAVVAGLSYVMPSDLVTGASWVWPSNANACIAAMASARITRWVFDWNMFFLASKV